MGYRVPYARQAVAPAGRPESLAGIHLVFGFSAMPGRLKSVVDHSRKRISGDACIVGESSMAARFTAGFDNSRIVDEHGAPMTVYHGTRQGSFETFTPRFRRGEQLGFGIHFAEDFAFALRYAQDKNVSRRGHDPFVHAAWLDIEHPLVANKAVTEGSPEFELAQRLAGRRLMTVKNEAGQRAAWMQNAIDFTSPERAQSLIVDAGYDGVIYEATLGRRGVVGYSGGTITSRSRAFVVFETRQIQFVDHAKSLARDISKVQRTRQACLAHVAAAMARSPGVGLR